MQDISAFGTALNIVASNTFPNGFTVTQFADDADPFDSADLKIADQKMGVNGDMITWSVASPIMLKIAVVPQSDDDQNLEILLDANRVAAGKTSAQDAITITASYPTGPRKQLTSGRIVTGPVLSSLAAVGRLKSKVYEFAFEQTSGGPA